MAQAKTYDMTVYPVQVAVRSQSDGAAVHLVTLPHCDCADFTNRKGKLADDGEAITICKHIREALARVGGWHRPEPEVHADLTYKRAAEILNGLGCFSPVLVSDALSTIVPHKEPVFLPSSGKPDVYLTCRQGAARKYTVTVYN